MTQILKTEEQKAHEFCQALEADFIARQKFLTENYQKSIWLECLSHKGKLSAFWQYGPPIPVADGFIYLLASVWENSTVAGWVIGDYLVLDGIKSIQKIYLTFRQAKDAVELEVRKGVGRIRGGMNHMLAKRHLQAAKNFVLYLENAPAAKRKFLAENYQDSIWLQCPPYAMEPVDFWQYGPPIPDAGGLIFLLGEVWKNPPAGGWVISGDCHQTPEGQTPEGQTLVYPNVYPDFDQAKDTVELMVKEKYG